MNRTLKPLFDAVDARPTSASYLVTAREIDRLAGELRPVRVALLSSFTIEPIVPYLKVEAARHDLHVDAYIGGFNAVQQELRSPSSGCLAFAPDVVFVAQLLADVCPELTTDFPALSEDAVVEAIDRTVADFVAAIGAFRGRSSAAIVVHNFAMPRTPALGVCDVMVAQSETAAVRRLNATLAEVVATLPGVYLLDYDGVSAQVGHRHWYDDKMWHLARVPLTSHALESLARRQSIYLLALFGTRRKCLAVDLDNTLWGGILGEAGFTGIELGHTYPGNAFRTFQEYLLKLHRRGVLLAIVSKNNAADVEDVLNSHPGMLLGPVHFAAIRANWGPKPENLADIADELSLGIDSFVFFDDDAVECALMRGALPDVLTVQAPPDVLRFPQALESCGVFERVSFTAEDRTRGQLYQRRATERRQSRLAGSVNEFLQGLEMSASIKPADAFAFPRILDLLAKTNQFNLTTRRYSAGELHATIDDLRCGVFYLHLSDRLADHGIVGVAIARVEGETAYLDAFVLSCRVIGRTAETALLAFVTRWAERRGATIVEGDFSPTRKNAPAADFYARHGFTNVPQAGSASRWRLTIADTPVECPSYIQQKIETATA
jgi:FkbH-like protein